MIYMFLSNNPSSGDINSSNLSCLEHIMFLNCSYICSWLFLRQSMNIIKCVLELFLNVFLIISNTYLEYNVSSLIYGT